MERTTEAPEEHLRTLPDDVRTDMQRLHGVIADAMPDHPRTVWKGRLWGGTDQTIIGYGDYTYWRSKGDVVDWFVVGLAAQRRHLSIYVNAADEDGYIVQRYADRLGKVKVGSAAITFRSADDVDLDVLAELAEVAGRQVPPG
jgi:hypothetical protein